MSLLALVLPLLFLIVALAFPGSVKGGIYFFIVGCISFLLAIMFASDSSDAGALVKALKFQELPLESNLIFRFVQTGYGFCIAGVTMLVKALLLGKHDTGKES